jgi:two-component sensor histidine kinase
VTDPELQALVRRTEERIQAMSTVQDLLLDMPNLAAVEMEDYFRHVADFVDRIVASSGLIHVNVVANDIRMEAPTAIALGLIVTELLSNALKHAFPDGATGVVGIELLEDHDAYLLRVRDNGLGMPPAYERSGGLGITLVESFVAQLDGTITIEHRGGTVVTARFYRRHSGTTEGVAAAV